MANNNKNYTKSNNKGKGRSAKDKDYKNNNPKSKGSSCKYEDIKGNDITWWNKSSLYPLATNVPYNKMPGYIYDQANLADSSYSVSNGNLKSIPSVMTIEYIPTLGKAEDSNSPVNLCFNSLFAELVAHYSNANVGFQQMDLALMTLAVTSIITQIAEAERALGLTNLYFRENAAFPRGIAEALNIDFDNLVRNKANYTLRLQNIVQNFNALRIPSYIDLFKRCMQLGHNVYMDEDNIMSQAYVFVSRGYYAYRDTEMKLEYGEFVNEYDDLSEKLDVLETCLELLRNTSDLGNIMGVLRKAFPETSTIQLDIPTTMDITVPYHDRNVAWQVNNLMILPGKVVNLDVTQDPVNNVLKCNPLVIMDGVTDEEFFRRSPGYGEEMIVNSWDGEIGPEFIMESTRFMFAMDRTPDEYIDGVNESHTGFALKTFGTELVSKVLVYTAVKSTANDSIIWSAHRVEPIINMYQFGTDNNALVAPFQNAMNTVVQLSKFRNHPRIAFIQSDAETVEPAIWYGFMGDLNIYTTISTSQLEYINLAALQSVFLITTSGERNI